MQIYKNRVSRSCVAITFAWYELMPHILLQRGTKLSARSWI